MAVKFQTCRWLSLALGLLCAGATASATHAQDFLYRYQQGQRVSQTGYNNACGDGCTSACGNGCCDSGCAGLAPLVSPDGTADPNLTDPGRDLTAPVAPPSNLLASSFGASQGGAGAPNMIGDFFSGGINLGGNFAFSPMTGNSHDLQFAHAPIMAGDRLLKIVEFNSPIPTDRVFFTYNHFHNALQESIGGGVEDRNLDRFTFGLEKTFNGGNSSIELRLPIVSALDATQNTGDNISEEAVLFGNLALNLNTILRQNYNTTYTAGLGIILPTAPDTDVTFGGNRLLVENEAVFLAPWIGMVHTPNDLWFTQAFLQFAFDLNGNSFAASTGEEGVFQSQHLAFLSGTVGRWIYRDPCGCNYITGIAPVMELHFSRQINDADNDGAGGAVLFANNNENQIDVLNLTAGTHFELGPLSTLTVAVVAPLLQDPGKLFDTEIGVQFNRRF